MARPASTGTTSIAANPHRIIWLGRFAHLTDTASLVLADPDPTGQHQAKITDPGRTRYAQLRSAARDHH